jgi:hypothetical protein
MKTEDASQSAIGTGPVTVSAQENRPRSGGGASSTRVLSQNGTWWWNGRRWVAAVSEDGLWRWSGTQWKSTVDLEGKRPEQLSELFTSLADDCYARAGAVLTDHMQDWQPEGEVRQLVGQIQGIQARLQEFQSAPVEAAGGRGRLLGRHSTNRERSGDDDARAALNSEYITLAVRLARMAPQPTFKEADDVLTVAHLLDDHAARLDNGVAEVEEAERMRAEAASRTQEDLSDAEERRSRALEGARKAIESAEVAYRRALAGARSRVRALLTPGPGELKAALGPLRLHAASLETPAGRLPAAGLAGYADTAEALWQQHRQALSDQVLVGGADVESFLTALTEKSADVFLFFEGPSTRALCAAPRNQASEARRFAATVTRHGADATSTGKDRDAQVREAEAELARLAGDRSSIEAGEAELARLEADPALLGAVDAARRNLERARGDTPELIAARRRVGETARQLTAPPEPLRAERAVVASSRNVEGDGR